MTDTKNNDAKNNESQDSASAQEQDWKAKFNDLVQSCQTELKRTTQIGMKMLSASQSNAQLHEKYEDLGRMALSALEKKEIEWESPEAQELVGEIKALRQTLEALEKDVADIKKN